MFKEFVRRRRTSCGWIPSKRGLGLLGIALTSLTINSACSTMHTPPPELAARIREVGPKVDARGMAALYKPLQEREPYVGIHVTRDLSYGPDPQNLADVFTPSDRGLGKKRPVLLFVHGGGFTAGERRLGPDSPFYDNIGVWAVRHGFIGINMTYRRAPQAQWPAGPEDIGRAVDWVGRTIADQGGDAKRIFILGHSAGATHVAGYISHPQFHGESTIKGAIIVSGSFEVTPTASVIPEEATLVQHEKSYFGEDPSLDSEQSSTAGLVSTPIPLLFVNAEYDPPFFKRHAAALRTEFQRAHRQDRFIVLPVENHMSQIFSINTPDEGLSRAVEEFTRGLR
jgi:triacylglycerol lipase